MVLHEPSSAASFGQAARVAALAGILAAGTVWGACGSSLSPCSVPADCASGICRPDGTCRPIEAMDSVGRSDVGADTSDAVNGSDVAVDGTLDAVPGDAADDGAADAPQDGTPSDGQAGSGLCTPTEDGIISRAEMPIAVGLQATYRVALDTAVDLAGTMGDDGVRRWDLSGDLEGDRNVLVEAMDPTDWWFAGEFPGATYVARLSEEDDLLGVFRATDDELQLLGIASPDDGLFRTRLTYDPPAVVLKFPLELGDSWTSSSSVSGLTRGVISAASESYVYEVDAAGELSTPFADFPVLRLRVELDRVVGFAPYSERSVLFVAECFGTVASARSEGYESDIEFEQAAEVRRLAP